MLKHCFLILLAACALVGSVGAKTVRVATFNIQDGPGGTNTNDYNATKAIVQRINADIVAFQEIRRSSTNLWQQMATELGYTNVHLGTTDTAGNFLLGFFSRFPLQATNLSSAAPANEFTRRPMRVVVQVPGAARPLVMWNMHHKADSTNSSEDAANQFRRAIEARRIVQDINAYRSANPTHSELVMLGDLNENIFSTNTLGVVDLGHQAIQFTQTQFTNSLLPIIRDETPTYALGTNISFPVPYKTFPDDRYAEAGLQRLNLRQQNGTWTGTRGGRYVALDYILVSAPLTIGATGEIYNSIHEPAGLPKAGAPLPTNTSDLASDHFAVFADIQMQDATNTLSITPSNEVRVTGSPGGPFTPASTTYTISNPGAQPVSFTVSSDVSWLVPQISGGTVPGNGSTNMAVSINAAVAPTPPGEYVGRITVNGVVRAVRLVVLSPVTDYLTQQFTTPLPFNLANRSVTFTPDGSVNFYRATIAAASAFPVNPGGGLALPSAELYSQEVTLAEGRSFPFFGVAYTRLFVGSAGYITFTGQDFPLTPSIEEHFRMPRISGLFFELDPRTGTVSYKQLPDRVAVTYQNVPQYGAGGSNNFQIEMFFDGRIRLTWLGVGAAVPSGTAPPLVGLSPGGGSSPQFKGSTFTTYPATPPESAFETFVRGYGLDPAGSGAPGADHDKDGFSNWAEFAFGTSPVSGDSFLVRMEKPAGEMFCSFLARAEGLTYLVEHSADLLTPFVAASGITLTTPGDQTGVPPGWLRRRFVVPPGVAGFYRIRAAEPGQN